MTTKLFNFKARWLLVPLVLLTLGVGNVWGASVTWPKTTALPDSYTNIADDANVQIKVSSTNSYTSPIRVYASTTVSIKVASGYTIESVTYEASATGNYVTNAQNATVSPNVTPTVSSKLVTWTFASETSEFTFTPSAQTRSNGITVVYSSTGGGSTPVTGVSVSPTSKSIVPGETFTITPTVAPAGASDKSVSWTSSVTSKATVNSSGVVTGVAAGTSTITCTTTDGSYTATCAVTVCGVTMQARDEDGNAIGAGGPGPQVVPEHLSALLLM